MGLIFGAYSLPQRPGTVSARWEAATDWLRSTYPELSVSDRHVSPLWVGTAVPPGGAPVDASGESWQALAVGSMPDRPLADPNLSAQTDADAVREELARHDGRFGCAVWSAEASSAWVVTDWAGWYPLFWARCGDATVFSSHWRVLCMLLDRMPQIDPLGAAGLLALGYSLDERTLLQGVSVLRPGESLALHLGRVEAGRWRLPFSMDGFDATPQQLHRRFKDALLDSVRGRIDGFADSLLPLSGGMDSRLIAACLRELKAPVTTCTHDWRNRADWVIARKVARRLGCRHVGVRVRAEDLAERIDRAEALGCADTVLVDTFYAKLPRSTGSTVLLSGNVGDAMEGVGLPNIDAPADALHDAFYHHRRRLVWSDEEIAEIGRRLGLDLRPDDVYAQSRDVLARGEAELPFQRWIWWNYMGPQRRFITYHNRTCDLHMPPAAPYVDRRVFAELLSWPREMLAGRRGVYETLRDEFPDLARIPRVKEGGLSRIQMTLWGALAEAVAWRLPRTLRPVLPVALGGGREFGPRRWARLPDLLVGRAAWLTDDWRQWLGPGLRHPRRFLALATLLGQIEECAS